MALQQDRTDTNTLATYKAAYGRLDKAQGVLEKNELIATLNWYVNAGAAARSASGTTAGQPVTQPDIIQLTTDEATQFRAMALQALYVILMARPEYAAATAV